MTAEERLRLKLLDTLLQYQNVRKESVDSSSVTSKKPIEPVIAKKAGKAAARPFAETGSRTPKNVNANPPRTELTNAN